MADKGQQTEQPTERRVEKARREGNFPVSREFVAALQFTAFIGILGAFSTGWLISARQLVRSLLSFGFHTEVGPNEVVMLFRRVLVPAALPLFVAGLGLMAATVAVQLATTRMGVSLKRLQPDFQRLNPIKKLQSIPRQNLPQFLQALVLLPLFLFVVYALARNNLDAYLGLPLLSVESGVLRVGNSIKDLLWRAAALFLLLGCIDLVRQRRRYRKDLRMSKQEIRDEFKEVEGNPQIKARVRRLQRDLLRRQMMTEVPKATAVIVNPTHYAVAVRYQVGEMAAPKVVAKGRNYLALRIRERAIEYEVPVVENPPLAQALYKSVDVGQEIPIHLYRAVAEVLAYIYRLMNGHLPGVAPGAHSGG